MAGLARSAATSQPPRGIEGALSEVRDGEVLIERPDGSRITVIVNIRPFKNERGDVTGAINCLLRIAAQRGFEKPFLEFFDAVHGGQAAWGTAWQRGESSSTT